MERSWAEALDDGKEVAVIINPRYVSTSLSPVAFRVKYRIGAENWQNKSYPN